MVLGFRECETRRNPQVLSGTKTIVPSIIYKGIRFVFGMLTISEEVYEKVEYEPTEVIMAKIEELETKIQKELSELKVLLGLK